MLPRRCLSFMALLLAASGVSARATDEIQVYNAEIAKVGQWTFQLHSNYAFIPPMSASLRKRTIGRTPGLLWLPRMWQIEFDAPEPARLMPDVPHDGLPCIRKKSTRHHQ